jgi:signal transduction histidine kinase
MKFWRSRTTLALVLTVAALVVPCAAWYVAGMRDVERDAAQIEAGPRRIARETATQLAGRLEERLVTLIEAESSRPFYHYQSLYHDPKGVSEGASVVPSPLAQGPADPLVRAYFQIDPHGQVTLPTLPEGDLDAADQQRAFSEHGVQKELQLAVLSSVCVASLQQDEQQPWAKSTPAQLLTAAISSEQSAPPSTGQSLVQSPFLQPHYEVMEFDAYQQNARAIQIYSDLKSGSNLVRRATPLKDENQKKVAIAVSGFQWCSLQMSNGQSLVALRDVTTPDGVLVQGFVISNDGVAEALKNAALPARFLPNSSAGAYVVSARVESAGWYIVVSAAKEFDAAHLRVHHSEATFLEFFLAGVGAASIAGLCVVVLVWQTEQLARQRSQFAASAAHELRTPLAGLRMYSEMLAEGLGDPSRAKDYAHRAAEEAARLGRVVSNVLGFTRLERGALQVRPEPGDLAAVVRDCVDRQRPALEAAGASIELSVADDLPEMRFDRDAVAEILQNLIDNAEKYSRPAKDRSIEVALGCRREGREEGRFVGSGAIISVSDRGPGIPADMRRRLFRPFARGSQDDAPAGLGLGLALVKALAEAHRGAVSYEARPGGGSVFTVFLPK